MPRLLFAGLFLLGGLFVPARVDADSFTINLSARSGKARQTAEADVTGQKPRARAVLKVKAGAPVTVAWKMQNTDAMTTYKNVLVHFFVVREKKIGQETLPKLTKGVAVESAQSIDFKPKDSTQGELTFTIEKPGSYLLRLETVGTAGKDGHEHFAALDLQVQ